MQSLVRPRGIVRLETADSDAVVAAIAVARTMGAVFSAYEQGR